MFTYRMILKDGTPADPPQFVTAVPGWRKGETVVIRPGFRSSSSLARREAGARRLASASGEGLTWEAKGTLSLKELKRKIIYAVCGAVATAVRSLQASQGFVLMA